WPLGMDNMDDCMTRKVAGGFGRDVNCNNLSMNMTNLFLHRSVGRIKDYSKGMVTHIVQKVIMFLCYVIERQKL
ncbi:hypothetical protein ACJX0J_036541, partial [Zea mays]